MAKSNANITRFQRIYKAILLISLALPVLTFPPYFFPADWGKTIVFRSIMAILLFLFVFKFLFRKKQLNLPNFRKNAIFWALTSLFIVYLLASIFSVDPLFSFLGSPYRGGGSINFVFYIIFALLAFISLKKEDWENAWNFSIIIGILVSLISFAQYYGLFIPKSAIYSTMGNIDILAMYLLLLSFLTLSFAIKEQRKSLKIFYGFSLFLFLSVIILTGSRAAYLGILIGGIYFFLSYPKKIKSIKIAIICLLVLLAGFVFYTNTTSIYPRFLANNSIFQLVQGRISLKLALAEPRFSVWKIALDAIKTKPLLGYGPENFSVGFDKYYNPSLPYINMAWGDWYDRAHNIILQTGSDAGIFGIISYLALFSIIFWQLQKTKHRSENADAIIPHGIQATLIGYLVANFFSFDTFSTYLIFFLLVGYSLQLTTIQNETQTSDEAKKTWWKPLSFCILFLILIIFLWQYNLIPLQVNAEINKAKNLVNHKQCDRAFVLMDKASIKHSFLDSYLLLEYVQAERNCSAIFPNNNLVYTNKGVELLREAVKIQPLYTRFWLFLGNLTTTLAEQETVFDVQKELTQQAIAYFEKALRLSPKHQEILTGLAKIELSAGNYQEGKNYSKECADLDSSLGDCYWYLGLSETYLKDNTQANKNIQSAKDKGYKTDSEASLVELGNAYNSLSDYKNLAIVFEKLIAINPDVVQYHSSLATIYAKLGQYNKARQEASKVLELSPASKDNVNAFLRTLP